MVIPTFIINLKTRTDRKAHIELEFADRDEFLTTIVDAHTHDVGAVGLWNTIRHIIKDLTNPEDDFVLICEDDHVFTESYSKDVLIEQITEAESLNCDILSGGVSWFMDAVQVSDHLFWTKKFSGTQFIIIFKKFFEAIINAQFTVNDCADFKLAAISDKIYFTFPFLSIQKEFGYSDATQKNNGTERVEVLFANSSTNAQNLIGVRHYYEDLSRKDNPPSLTADTDNLSIPTYIITLPERVERRNYIVSQFEGKPEFDITMVDACKHEIEALGRWQNIRKVIELAILNDDHVIVICEDDHEFTSSYSKEFLFKNIIQAQKQRCDYLSGGTEGFHFAVPVSKNRFWTNHCLPTQFMILFRKVFKKILDEPFDETIIADKKISQLATNKLILFPFVSNKKDFGYSDVAPMHNEQKGTGQNMFVSSWDRLKIIQKTYLEHSHLKSVQTGLHSIINFRYFKERRF
ncbi:MAG: hypothetical protein QM640_00215 [Niabella sp.]